MTALSSPLVLLAEDLPAMRLKGDDPIGEKGGWRSALEKRGVTFSLEHQAEGWANVSGGRERGGVYTGLLEGGVKLDLEKLVGWKGATFYNRWMVPYGRDLSSERVGNLFTVSNAAGYPSLFLYELWLEQELMDGALSIRIGQLAADEEFAGSKHGSLLLNAAFGWPFFLSENLPNGGPAFPRGTLGARIAVRIGDGVTLQSAIYQGDPFEPGDSGHGMKWRPGGETGYLLMNEAQFRWNHEEKAEGLAGEVKGGFWYHTSEVASPDVASTRRFPGTYGFYGVIDQMLYRLGEPSESSPDRGVAWFARVAVNPQEQNVLGFYVDTGVSCTGWLASRREDTVAIGFACGRLTRGARQTLIGEGSRGVGEEMLVELTYRCQVTPWLAVQPDLQWIIHPGATRDFGNAVVVGIRSTITF